MNCNKIAFKVPREKGKWLQWSHFFSSSSTMIGSLDWTFFFFHSKIDTGWAATISWRYIHLTLWINGSARSKIKICLILRRYFAINLWFWAVFNYLCSSKCYHGKYMNVFGKLDSRVQIVPNILNVIDLLRCTKFYLLCFRPLSEVRCTCASVFLQLNPIHCLHNVVWCTSAFCTAHRVTSCRSQTVTLASNLMS